MRTDQYAAVWCTGNGSSPSWMMKPSTRWVRISGLARSGQCCISAGPVWLDEGLWAGGLSNTAWNLGGELQLAGDTSDGRITEDWTGDRSEDRLDIAKETKKSLMASSFKTPIVYTPLFPILHFQPIPQWCNWMETFCLDSNLKNCVLFRQKRFFTFEFWPRF